MGVSVDAQSPQAIEGALCDYMARMNMRSMIVTFGEKGAVWHDGSTFGYLPVAPIAMTDSTGAGDSFFSGTVAALAKGYPLGEAVRFGARVAAFTICSAESTCIGFTEKI